jgi:heme-degrading monooxygenase HmoA
MAHLLVHHQVGDFDTWKAAFDQHDATRRASGGGNYMLFRSADDPNEVVVVFEWDSVENARAFSTSDDLREAMQRAGVAGPPTIVYMDQYE